jgi:subtilisin-like proprotein convertase family protein
LSGNSPLNRLVVAEQQSATQLRFRATGFGAFLSLTATERGTGLGHSLGTPLIDVNEDGVDDLVIGAPLANGEENAVAVGKVYVIEGSLGTVAMPTTFEIRENISYSGSGSLLVDRGTDRQERFTLTAPPAGVEEPWHRFTTLGDGVAGNAIWINGGWADLVDSSGRVLIRDAAIVDLRRIEAGTYHVRVGRGDFSAPNVLKPLADNATMTSTLQVGALAASIIDVDVRLDIAHANVNDLRIFLISPAGTRREIVNRAGGSDENFTGTIFDDEAATLVQNASAPFTGRFRPTETLSAFDGQNPNGAWTLEVQDAAGGSAGTLLGWSLSIFTTAGSIDVEAPTRSQDHETTALPDRDTVFGGEGDDLIVAGAFRRARSDSRRSR